MRSLVHLFSRMRWNSLGKRNCVGRVSGRVSWKPWVRMMVTKGEWRRTKGWMSLFLRHFVLKVCSQTLQILIQFPFIKPLLCGKDGWLFSGKCFGSYFTTSSASCLLLCVLGGTWCCFRLSPLLDTFLTITEFILFGFVSKGVSLVGWRDSKTCWFFLPIPLLV